MGLCWTAVWNSGTCSEASWPHTQVFDGHSGENAARFAEQHLLPNLLSQETFLTAPAEALVSMLWPGDRYAC